jgi:hypothetical protein
MLQQGWKGQWVAISGAEILSHSDSKRALREKYCALHREKKLLLRKVFPPATNQEFEIW